MRHRRPMRDDFEKFVHCEEVAELLLGSEQKELQKDAEEQAELKPVFEQIRKFAKMLAGKKDSEPKTKSSKSSSSSFLEQALKTSSTVDYYCCY